MKKRSRDGYRLSEDEVLGIIRLLGKVAGSGGDHAAKKRQLMDGLCELISADSWAWSIICAISPGTNPLAVQVIYGGWTEDQFALFLQALEHPDTALLNAPLTHEFAEKKTHLTRLRQQIDPENLFAKTDVYRLWQAADVDAVMMSIRPLDARTQTAVALYRKVGCPLFTERESRIAHIILSEVPWLHEAGWAADRGATVPGLSPRQRVTLNLLLDGQSRRQIAEHLKIAQATADGYVKEVFRHFRVHSQSELIARFFRGDGGDLARSP